MKIAIEFDGVCVENTFPSIGEPVPFCTGMLLLLSRENTLILNTFRQGDALKECVQWFQDRAIPITVPPDGKKPIADVYIDEKGLMGLPKKRGKVDWLGIGDIIKTLKKIVDGV